MSNQVDHAEIKMGQILTIIISGIALVLQIQIPLIILGCIVIYLLKGKVDIKPTYLGKTTTFFQMMSVLGILVQFPYSKIIWNITVILTVLSGLDYLRSGSRMLNDNH